MSSRIQFLSYFLGALGAQELKISSEDAASVCGTVIYDRSDPEEIQDFCWHMKEEDVPRGEVFELVRILEEGNLLDIDVITIPICDLRERYNQICNTSLSIKEFESVVSELLEVVVQMMDDGVEGDIFFIHT